KATPKRISVMLIVSKAVNAQTLAVKPKPQIIVATSSSLAASHCLFTLPLQMKPIKQLSMRDMLKSSFREKNGYIEKLYARYLRAVTETRFSMGLSDQISGYVDKFKQLSDPENIEFLKQVAKNLVSPEKLSPNMQMKLFGLTQIPLLFLVQPKVQKLDD